MNEEVIKPHIYEPFFQDLFARGEVRNEDVPLIERLSNDIFFKHFQHQISYKDDLIQEGLMGIIVLSRTHSFDKTRSALNFAYTRIRNCMTNYLAKKNEELYEDFEFFHCEAPNTITQNKQYNDILKKVREYIQIILDNSSVTENVKFLIKCFFDEKLEIEKNIDIIEINANELKMYCFYINYIEYKIAKEFKVGSIISTHIGDLVEVIESEGEDFLVFKLLSETFSRQEAEKILYCLAGLSLKMPSKKKILRSDYYLKVYQNVTTGKLSHKEASNVYDKSLEFVVSLERRYSKIFAKEIVQEEIIYGTEESRGEQETGTDIIETGGDNGLNESGVQLQSSGREETSDTQQ